MGGEVRGDGRWCMTVHEDWNRPRAKGHRSLWKLEKARKLILLRASRRKVTLVLAPARFVFRFLTSRTAR